MDAVTPKNSRWTREPTLRDGKPRKVPITARDVEILKALHRHRYLQSDDIHALVGGSYVSIRKRLNLLSRKPNLLINRPHQQRENANANYTRLVYELDTAGATILREQGLSVPPKTHHRNFPHELMVNRIMASIEIGAREASARLIRWPDIIASENMPRRTREANRPTQIPYDREAHIEADGAPFGLQIGGSYMFFPGVEADCSTEPITTSDYERSSIYRKFEAYLTIIQDEIYRSHFGFPVMYVPFFFPTIARNESAMHLLERMTETKPSLRRYFLFKTFPTLTSFGKQAPATGHVFTEPFARVKYAPFTLAKPK